MIATDFSDFSLEAARWSTRALAPRSQHLLPLGRDAAYLVEPDPGHSGEWVRKRGDWLREQVRRAGIDANTVEIRVIIGSSAAEIVTEQERYGADLIVMGSHDRGSIGRVLLGSVAGAVLRTASCSVLVVREPDLPRVRTPGG